ncbi:hypothetical protein DF183_09565 [Alcaligenes faecalis]|uniref:Uncharacterized protein n=1 Tax=Alcaligenes faecalis TaxID=511 RepID=A0A2U2BLN7_ALCFA|nr:hypothetical protein DF183_09565 [Alcaligenes faecalis]
MDVNINKGGAGMGERVLVLALNIAIGAPGEIRDVSLSTQAGFTSKTTSEAAALTISSRLVAVVGQARMQAGMQGNGGKSPRTELRVRLH